MKPEISVIIPTYKRPDLLFRCLKSICFQELSKCQIIVVDNDGCDNSVKKTIESFEDSKIEYALQTLPGVSAARNKGVELAKADFVLFVDDDDELKEAALYEVWKFINDAVNNDISFGWCAVEKVYESDGCKSHTKNFQVSVSDIQNKTFLLKIGTGCGLFVRKSDFIEAGGFDVSYKLSEDRDLLFKLVKSGKQFKPLNKVLYKRYYHQGERLSHSLHALEEAYHDYRLYYDHIVFMLDFPELRLRLLDLRAMHYSIGNNHEKAVECALHAWQIAPTRVKSVRRLVLYWFKERVISIKKLKSMMGYAE